MNLTAFKKLHEALEKNSFSKDTRSSTSSFHTSSRRHYEPSTSGKILKSPYNAIIPHNATANPTEGEPKPKLAEEHTCKNPKSPMSLPVRTDYGADTHLKSGSTYIDSEAVLLDCCDDDLEGFLSEAKAIDDESMYYSPLNDRSHDDRIFEILRSILANQPGGDGASEGPHTDHICSACNNRHNIVFTMEEPNGSSSEIMDEPRDNSHEKHKSRKRRSFFVFGGHSNRVVSDSVTDATPKAVGGEGRRGQYSNAPTNGPALPDGDRHGDLRSKTKAQLDWDGKNAAPPSKGRFRRVVKRVGHAFHGRLWNRRTVKDAEDDLQKRNLYSDYAHAVWI